MRARALIAITSALCTAPSVTQLAPVTRADAGVTLARIPYQKVTQNHFLWRADVSPDQGQTWLIDQWILEASRMK